MRIISLDPGLHRTGYAVLSDGSGDQFSPIWGCITTDRTDTIEKRFSTIASHIQSLITKHKPEVMVIEQLFFSTNQKTVIAVAQAQGVLMYIAVSNKLPITFLTPMQIKQTITGYGRADKQQVQRMVQLLLNLDAIPTPDDAADAIACGLAYFSTAPYAR